MTVRVLKNKSSVRIVSKTKSVAPAVISEKVLGSVAALLPTIPARYRSCQKVVQELLTQKVDIIVLHLNGHDVEPPWAQNSRISIHRNPINTGPIVRWRDVPDTDFVLGVDDDLFYPKDYIAKSVNHLRRLGRGNVISYHCSRWPKGKTQLEERTIFSFGSSSSVYLACSYMGSGASGFFGDDLKRIDRQAPEMFSCLDDVWISSATARVGFNIYRPPSALGWIKAQPEQQDGIYKREVAERFASRRTAITEAMKLGGWSLFPQHSDIR